MRDPVIARRALRRAATYWTRISTRLRKCPQLLGHSTNLQQPWLDVSRALRCRRQCESRNSLLHEMSTDWTTANAARSSTARIRLASIVQMVRYPPLSSVSRNLSAMALPTISRRLTRTVRHALPGRGGARHVACPCRLTVRHGAYPCRLTVRHALPLRGGARRAPLGVFWLQFASGKTPAPRLELRPPSAGRALTQVGIPYR